MWYTIKAYLNFLRKATNQHGVHSPFVYQFVTQCLYDTKKHPQYDRIKDYQKQLFKTEEEIEVLDFGVGSRIFKTNKRAVRDIAKHAGATLNRMKLLFRVVSYFKSESILELGTSVGLATAGMALGGGNLISLEGCPQTAGVAQNQLNEAQINNVKVVIGNFRETLEKQTDKKYDLIYFDGNHSKKATLEYFEKLLPSAHNDSVWIFDDIYWSSEMTEAWQYIKNHPKVVVTVDCFWLGFVFFRKEQVKENFRIRV
ncbi:O-methyltransferase [Leeuwenhoekiella sp. W20_SRS_FM14]|uniref:O-methyltransferase n=1 Tax=Leeuwenhoekiella sp. W20_SRS_FM14 TaxID=3240270 RepID=UPI003F9BBB21